MSRDENDHSYVDKDGNGSRYDLSKLSAEERLKIANRRALNKIRTPSLSEAELLKECGLTAALFYKLSAPERLKLCNRVEAKLKSRAVSTTAV